jgi:chemotaxis protein MotA
VKGVAGGVGKVFKGPKYKKDDYLSIIFIVAKILKTLKSEGAVALEAHIENPEASAIFGEYPALLKDHTLLHFITDTIRLMVVSSSSLSPYAVEEVMDTAIKTHHHAELKPAEALVSLAGCLASPRHRGLRARGREDHGRHRPAATRPGALIGSALVGTFLGVFLSLWHRRSDVGPPQAGHRG